MRRRLTRATAALGIALSLLVVERLPTATWVHETAPVGERNGSIPVSLNARPWARIEVDGREVGITPLANLPMAPGPHRFRAHLSDGRLVERTLRVDAHRNHISFP